MVVLALPQYDEIEAVRKVIRKSVGGGGLRQLNGFETRREMYSQRYKRSDVDPERRDVKRAKRGKRSPKKRVRSARVEDGEGVYDSRCTNK